MSRHSQRLLLYLLVAILSGGCFAQSSKAGASENPDAPKETSVAVAIAKLRKEALDSWQQDNGWPRSTPNFAAEMNWTVPEEQIVRALSRRLDRNPAIDAYLKWQLLSFGPDLTQVSSDTFTRIFSVAPEPLDAPRPRVERRRGGQAAMMFFGRQTAHVADLDPVVGRGAVAYKPRVTTFSRGTGIGVGGGSDEPVDLLKTVRNINRQLSRAQGVVERANEPVLAYREALMDRLPDDPALKMGVMIKDVGERIQAGDATFDRAADRLMRYADELSPDSRIVPEARARLIEWAKALADLRTSVVVEVTLEGGDFHYEDRVVRMQPDQAEKLLNHLQKVGPAAAP